MAAGPVHVAVAGPGDATPEICTLAREVGRLLAERGAVVVTGGHAPAWDLAAPKDPGTFPAAPPTAEDPDDDEEPATAEEVLA